MRSPKTLLTLLAILLASCASSPDDPTPARANGTTAARPEAEPAPPPDVKNVTGNRIRVVWRDLNPSHERQRLGLINRSSPDLAQLYRAPADWQGFKPVDDETIANVLAAFKKTDFYELATKGMDASSYSVGDGHGVISLTVGDESWALFFPRMGAAKARGSKIPETYVDLKKLILYIHSTTAFLAPSAPQDPDRVFRTPSIDRRR